MEERRKTFRGRTYLGGQVAFDNSRSAADCLVRNLSPEGAKIVFSAPTAIPNEFELTIPRKGDSRGVRVVWRDENEAGVVFLANDSGFVASIEAGRKIRRLEVERDALARRVAQLSGPTC